MSLPRILLIEDSPGDAELVAMELADAGIACDITRVELPAELEAALDEGPWALVLCDSRLPGFSGEDAFRRVREKLPRVPFIFCTGGGHDPQGELAQAIHAADGHVDKNRLQQLPALARKLLA